MQNIANNSIIPSQKKSQILFYLSLKKTKLLYSLPILNLGEFYKDLPGLFFSCICMAGLQRVLHASERPRSYPRISEKEGQECTL